MNLINTQRLSKPDVEPQLSSYEALADQYYDIAWHPTCHAFRVASRQIIMELLGGRNPRGRAVEVGAGKSIIPECVPSWRERFDQLILIDSSPSMLAYSNALGDSGAILLLEDAQSTSIQSSSIDLVISSLGDPYNTRALWIELRRILAPGAVVVFTTPSPQWAARFRPEGQASPENAAEFLSRKGGWLQVPSFILGEDEQREAIRSAGLLPESVCGRSQIEVDEAASAPKLNVLGATEPFVIGYLASCPR